MAKKMLQSICEKTKTEHWIWYSQYTHLHTIETISVQKNKTNRMNSKFLKTNRKDTHRKYELHKHKFEHKTNKNIFLRRKFAFTYILSDDNHQCPAEIHSHLYAVCTDNFLSPIISAIFFKILHDIFIWMEMIKML